MVSLLSFRVDEQGLLSEKEKAIKRAKESHVVRVKAAADAVVALSAVADSVAAEQQQSVGLVDGSSVVSAASFGSVDAADGGATTTSVSKVKRISQKFSMQNMTASLSSVSIDATTTGTNTSPTHDGRAGAASSGGSRSISPVKDDTTVSATTSPDMTPQTIPDSEM
jgi:hypothetical protein